MTDYWINNYRTRKIGDKLFVTTDSGSYAILDIQEYARLKKDDISGELKNKLIEREIIIDENNFDENLMNLHKRYNFLFSGASLHIIVTSLRCNMKCIYCHASSKEIDCKEYDMDLETAKKTVDFIFQTPNKNIHIEFQGGEPLLNWEAIRYITEYSKKKEKELGKSLIISLVTNLTEMDDEKMEFIIANDIGVCTSLDGPKNLHDGNRIWSKNSSYEKVSYWIKKFHERYEKDNNHNRKINALVTLTKKSLRYPKEIVDEYVKLGLNRIHLRFLNNLGDARPIWKNISYSCEEYLDFWVKAAEYIDKLGKEGIDIQEHIIAVMLSKINDKYDPNYVDLRSPCGAAIGQLVYDYNGDIYTCDEARMIGDDLFLLGNVKDEAYKDITTCDKACAVVNASINDQYICDNCAYKPYCGICPVCNFAEQGSLIGKISMTNRCKIFMAQFDWVVKKRFINADNG